DRVFAGGRQIGGQLTIKLEKAVRNSELTQLWNLEDSSAKSVNQYDNLIDHVSKYFTIVVLILAVGTGIYWNFADPSKMWNAIAAVLIVACPCALALALPFGLGHGMRILGDRGLYLKNAQVIEQLSKIKTIVFDKTGTLTRNDPMSIEFVGLRLNDMEQSLIKTVCANSAHPLSKLIASYFKENIEKLPISFFDEQIGKGLLAELNGVSIKIGSAEWIGKEEAGKLHETRVYVSVNNQYRGYFSILASYRKGIFERLQELKKFAKLHLLSGDNAMEEQHLSSYFDQLHFNQKPKDKLEYVNHVDGKVLMIGDGLNDSGALKVAAVGFSVCEDIHQFSPACDALLQADAMSEIPKILRFSKSVMRAIIAALILSFAYNIVGLTFAITGNLTPVISAILMPVSSITVVGFITLVVSFRGSMLFKN
ncbi:MAG: Cu+-exporting ATPase, partial [Cyclobacteriaceae bacterium]